MITAFPFGFSALKTVSVGLLTLAIRVTLSLVVAYSLSAIFLLLGTPFLYNEITVGCFVEKTLSSNNLGNSLLNQKLFSGPDNFENEKILSSVYCRACSAVNCFAHFTLCPGAAPSPLFLYSA